MTGRTPDRLPAPKRPASGVRSTTRLRIVSIASATALGAALACLCLGAGCPTLAAFPLLAALAAAGAVAATARRTRAIGLALTAVATLAMTALAWPWPRTTTGNRGAWTVVTADDAAPTGPATIVDETLDGSRLPAPWFSLVPERELVRLGVAFGLTPGERLAARGGALLDALCADDPAPSRVLDAWLCDRGHYRLLLPAGDGPFALVLFLHGHGGPFLAYAQLLAPLATGHRIAVALPSHGFGDWTTAAARERIDAVRAHVLARHPVREDRIVLAGLSAGAIGALTRFAADPTPFHGCVAISGVPFEPFPIAPALRGKPVLVVAGTRDERIPIARIRAVAASMHAAGAHARVDELDADHLLLLTHREEALTALAAACR